jgi:FkbM family methyltransferase
VNVIFLDVGAHEGQTLDEVTKPGYRFNRVYAFEPMPAQYGQLVDRFGGDPRVTLCKFGLADRTGTLSLYGDNTAMEASLHPTKRDVDASVVTECRFVRASEFFAENVAAGDIVVVKLNCEGAEIVILGDLIDSGEIWKLANVMIDFDIRKVAGFEHQEHELLDRFAGIGFDRYSLCDDVMVGATHQDRIANWLRVAGFGRAA